MITGAPCFFSKIFLIVLAELYFLFSILLVHEDFKMGDKQGAPVIIPVFL
jgi:hypothetical protein